MDRAIGHASWSLEALTIHALPAVDGIVMDAELPDQPCHELVRSLKLLEPSVTVIIVHRPLSEPCAVADHQLDTFDPKQLLSLMQSLCPEHAKAVEKRNEMLKAEEADQNWS